MGRRRKHPDGLPARVYAKHGAYYLFGRDGRWKHLSRIADGPAKMYEAFAKAIGEQPTMTVKIGNFPSYMEQFAAESLPRLRSIQTRKTYRRIYDDSIKVFAEFNVGQVAPAHIGRFIKAKTRVGTRMAQVYRGCLLQFFNWCCLPEQGLIGANPVREIKVKAPPKRKRKLNAAEFHAIRDALLIGETGKPTLAGEMMQCYLDLSYLIFQRGTDIRLLRWTQVGKTHIRFEPSKTEDSSGAAVDVPITPDIRAVLDRARQLHKIKSVYVINTLQGGAYTASGIRTAWDRACRRAGVVDATTRDIRPMALSDALQQGYTLEQLKDAAAHAEVGTTQGYIKGRGVVVSQVMLSLPKRREY